MWEEGFRGQEMCPLQCIGIFEDGKGDFAAFLYEKTDSRFIEKANMISHYRK